MFGDPVDNPMGWPIRKLSDVAKVDGTMTKEYEKYADYPHIGIDSIEKNTGILSGYRTVQEDNVISPKYYFGPQHILYSKIRPALNKVALPDFEGLCSADCYPLLVTGMCDRKFLAHVMRSDYFLDYVLSYSGRSQMPKVNRKQLEGFSFPCPPIELQKKFTVLIDQSDKSKFIGFKSQFIEMFGDEAKQVRLDELCLHFGDGDWIESKDQSEEGIRLIQTGNVGNGEYKDKDDKARYISEETFARLGCTEVFPGDILISRLPDPIGRACIVPEMPKSITAVDCTIVRLKDEILSTFFVNFTKTPMYNMQIDSFTTGSTRKRISRANLGSIMVPVPDLARQERFVLIAEQSDKSKLKEDFYENRIDTFIKRNTSWLWCWERRN